MFRAMNMKLKKQFYKDVKEVQAEDVLFEDGISEC